jgi:hypothetical protein
MVYSRERGRRGGGGVVHETTEEFHLRKVLIFSQGGKHSRRKGWRNRYGIMCRVCVCVVYMYNTVNYI